MNAQYNNFIGMYENVFPEYYCQHIISEFERFINSGMVLNRKRSENVNKVSKDDEHCFLNMRNHHPSDFQGNPSMPIFWDGLQKCFDEYIDEYDALKNEDLRCTSVKIQKTNPGGGYHLWHHEQGNGPSQLGRGLVYIAYLNNLDENGAGETEFLYQRLRVPPKENTMVIWPAAFTHTHRGNVVHGNTPKYIITGWFHYDS